MTLVVMMRRRRAALLSVIAVSVIVVPVLLLEISLAANTVEISDADITYQDPMTAVAVFKGIGEYYVQAGYLNTTNNEECMLQVSFSLYSGSQLNLGLYTKSITMKLTNAAVSTLAFGVNTYTEPPTQYGVDYGYEPPETKSVTIRTPFASAGSTWSFTVQIHDPPTINGTLHLKLVIGAQVIENQFLGKTYDLQTSLQIPAVR
jgi:hypothetical protein